MNPTIKLSKANPAVKALLAATFPAYKGRKVVAEIATSVTLWDTNYSGGTRNVYHFITPDHQERLTVPAPWVNRAEGAVVPLSAGLVVVEHSMFCGRDCGITVHVHPDLAPKMIDAPAA